VNRKAALSRWRTPEDPLLKIVSDEYQAEKLAAHAQKIIDAWPQLTPDQKARIATLLRTGRKAA
jgi:hypothetical protein